MSRARFVLVRPRNPLNIGAAARALANFGFDDLAVVEPFEPVWKEVKAAVGASALLERAPSLSLDEAVAGSHLVIGTHDGRRPGRRGRPRLELPALRGWLAERLPQEGGLAILFGSEKTGLSNEALARCHAVARIPTKPACPSMNLAQAVAVVAYELSRPAVAALPQTASPAMTAQQTTELVRRATEACRALGYRRGEPDHILADRFRALLLRHPLDKDEAGLIQALLRRVSERGETSTRQP